jgi:hypothetical protein
VSTLYVVEKFGHYLVAPGQYVDEWRECAVTSSHEKGAEIMQRRRYNKRMRLLDPSGKVVLEIEHDEPVR